MANKLANKKPGDKKSVNTMTETNEAMPVKEATALNGSDVHSSKADVFNAETTQVLRDASAGKNLTRYVDEDDLFRKLGIKIGKA